MRPYPAEAHRSDAKIGGYNFEWHSFEDVGRGLQQIPVSLFCAVKLQAFDAVDGINITCFKDFSEQSFNIRESIVELEQLGGIDRYHFRYFQHLYSFSRGFATKKTFHPCNDLIFKSEGLRNIDIVFEIINTRQTLIHKIYRPASVPNGLQIAAFLNGKCGTDGLNSGFCRF